MKLDPTYKKVDTSDSKEEPTYGQNNFNSEAINSRLTIPFIGGKSKPDKIIPLIDDKKKDN
ncbi:hypothetical protein N9A28_02550 [Sulfurimonas sp.]|nr:hypothetical protein [Sulfurimonas sp.]